MHLKNHSSLKQTASGMNAKIENSQDYQKYLSYPPDFHQFYKSEHTDLNLFSICIFDCIDEFRLKTFPEVFFLLAAYIGHKITRIL